MGRNCILMIFVPSPHRFYRSKRANICIVERKEKGLKTRQRTDIRTSYHVSICDNDKDTQPFHSQDLIDNSLYFYFKSYDVSLENFVSDERSAP